MKKKTPDRLLKAVFLKKMLLVVHFLFALSLTYASVDNQATLVTFTAKSESLNDVLIRFKDQAGIDILFNKQLIGNQICKDVNLVKQPVEVVLGKILEGTGFVFSKVDGVYVIKKEAAQQAEPQSVSGVVVDESGAPLPGVTVIVKGTSLGCATDMDGKFKLTLASGNNVVLVFSFIGMRTKEVAYAGQKDLKVVLEAEATEMEQVVVTGIFTRKKESFTGSATTVKKEDLQKMGNQNLLQSLKSLDPAFHIVENNDFGSDPNKAPQIQMRGQQSMPDIKGTYKGNPNQPLFILDGFEADITTVYDLDMNRIETIVLLKDAAAKAIYGAKAANGVVVIETHQPKAGKLRISYKGDLSLTVPDLTGYNLCNAQEKYEVEKAHGDNYDSWFQEQYLNDIKANVERGINTDWLAQPLRTGVGHRHSLYMEGGDERLRYGVDLLYNDIKGVMKGSDRKTFTGGFTLSYRYKDLLFRNQFSTSLNRADDSPYGEFKEYAAMNPYWTPYDENGDLKQIAGTTGGGGYNLVNRGNPLWNASIGTKNFSKYTNLTNNFYIEWQALESLKFVGRLGLSKNLSSREDFYPAAHTAFLGYSEDKFFERGLYSKQNGESSSVDMDITANYSLILDKHQIFLNVNYNMEQNRSEDATFSMVGFPNDKISFVTSGLKFNMDDYAPKGSDDISREIGILGALNYSYDDRYLADLSWRASASSRFGKDKRWGQFWSAGIGWNLHNEHFMENAEWLKQLKLRASTGYTGAQNFSPYQALAMFGYHKEQAYDNWIGSYLMALPNDNLKWQKTQDFNVGFDLNLFGRLMVSYDYYIQKTKDQLLALTVPPSMGFTSYMENIGSTENKGMELKLNAHLLYDVDNDRYLSASFSIAKNTNKLKKISNALQSYNDEGDNEILNKKTNKPRTRFVEGQSMNAIWAVRSLGINPATGQEVYLTKDGKTTTEWRAEDQVVCGDAMPKCSGTFGVNMDYRGIFMNLSFYYQFGGQTYNQTLVDRVENADITMNVDKRIYNSVWKKPGDVVDFAYNRFSVTKPSSRFVQDLNELRMSSLNVGYDFRHCAFMENSVIKQLKASFYMDDVFRASTVKAERGLTYPFARTFSFSLQATF